MALRISLILALLSSILAVEIDIFYEFGELAGDNRLQLGTDDIKRVQLRTPIAFYDQLYSTIWISDNGYVAFEEPATPDYRLEKFPLGFPAIGIFLGNSDTSWQGFITYREDTSDAIIQRATKDVRDHFTSAREFVPRSVLVVTWEYVGRFGDSRGEDANNYQLIVMSDGQTSYSIYFYLEESIEWLRSQENDPYAEAGFDKGDDTTYFTLPGSGQSELQASFVYGSNAGVRGMWLYQIGRVREPLAPDTSNEALPESVVTPEPDGTGGGAGVTGPQTCASGNAACHSNGRCVDYPTGFCCQCNEPLYGNGNNCLEKGQPQRVNGKVSGTINGVAFSDSDLHSYVVTAEGRAYTAISRVPGEIGPQLQLLYQSGGIISWLYGMTQQPAPNGFSLTGGSFNRSVTMRFDGGQRVVRFEQRIPGPDQHGYLQMAVEVNGELPDVTDTARINVDDFHFIYTRPQPGVLKSEGTRVMSVDGESREYTYEETVTYYHCKHRPQESWEADDLKVDMARLFVVYDKNQKVVRYAMSSKITPADAKDPCADSVGKCHSAAECVPVDDTFRCECRPGYVGTGLVCEDRDECAEGVHNCDVNAQCYNTEGSFVCRCKAGYRGDGVRCDAEQSTCADLRCHADAQCVFDVNRNQARCECNTGFRGNGMQCEREERLCGENRCDSNARCVYDPEIQGPRCECNTGFTGDGVTCREEISLERLCAQTRCDPNARCTMNADGRSVSCVCERGYTGDGYTCQREQTDRERVCAELRCDTNARCDYDERTRTGRCQCNAGYVGDGYSCTQSTAANPCDELRCDVNARCFYDQINDVARCRCNSGYSGDGFTCRQQTDEERVCEQMRCDVNARCLYEPITVTAVCQCRGGYRGDGQTCTREGEEEELCEGYQCHEFGECVTDEPTGRKRCLCRAGYRGDGYTQCAPEAGGRTCADIRCDVNARCSEDPRLGPVCRCLAGYAGDGYNCRREVSCNEVDNCHPYASCQYDDRQRNYQCVCQPGYTGDGVESCLQDQTETRDCNVVDNCDVNARCVPDAASNRFRCVCNEGYQGNGYQCRRPGCDVTRDCHAQATCLYDLNRREYACKCNDGWEGDGKICQELTCNQYNNCHKHARCVYNQEAAQYECRCKQGYVGDGKTCQVEVIPCNQVNNCDRNADCLYEETLGSYRCMCRAGFRGTGFKCFSVVDCRTDQSVCHQDASCIQTTEGYECVCRQGYRGDGRMCMAEDQMQDYLLFTQGMSVFQVPEIQTETKIGNLTFLIPGQTAVGIDFDCRNLYFYWTDVSGRTIGKARLDGTDSQNILEGLGSPEGVAVDWLAGNIFWTDSGLDRIEVSKIDGTNRKTIVDTDLVNPRGIAVDPSDGKIYWTDWNRAAPKIESANMDGSDRRTVVDTDLGLPNGIVYDFNNRKICWGDAGTRRIECSNTDGSARRTVYGTASYPFDLAVLGNKLYWTDWERPKVQNIDIDGGLPNEPLRMPPGGNGKKYGITSVERRCPAGNNACALGNGGCRFLCLPIPNGGRTCACPDDISEERCNQINLVV